ncbi:inositol monophosphatase family protein [Tomitella biformata]|uniref:inositol monophosphatase family protein n=1 Tax=Tomitella biformata TaxID=630403 RepID=UPI000465CEEE
MSDAEDRSDKNPANHYGGADPRPAPAGIDTEALLGVALEVALAAAELVRTRRMAVFGPLGGSDAGADDDAVQSKSTPTDPVTVVDTESEELVRAMLARLRPADAILGEEQGGVLASADGVRWVVDPIDGTVNFLYGIPAYAVSLAAQVGGRSVAGVVVDVARRLVYAARVGGGSTVTDADGTVTVLRATALRDPALALVATGFGYERERRVAQGRLIAGLLPQVRDIRRVGAAALDLCMVAAGAVDAHFEHGLSPWDWAAGALIAAEAGAIVRVPDANSRSADGQVTLAMAPGVADALTGLFEELNGLRAIPLS